MARDNTSGTISIADASLKLGKSYNQTFRLILTKRLRGWKAANGRWVVDLKSVDELRMKSPSHRQ